MRLVLELLLTAIAIRILIATIIGSVASYRAYRVFRKKHPCDTLRPTAWHRPQTKS